MRLTRNIALTRETWSHAPEGSRMKSSFRCALLPGALLILPVGPAIAAMSLSFSY